MARDRAMAISITKTKGNAPFALEDVHVVPVLRLARHEAKARLGVVLAHRAPDGRPLGAS